MKVELERKSLKFEILKWKEKKFNLICLILEG